MCDSSETAVKIIKQKKNFTKGDIIMLFETAISDIKRQGERINKIENDVSALKPMVEEIAHNQKNILEKLNEKGWWFKFWEKWGEKIVLVVIAAAVCVAFGISFAEIKSFIIGG